MILLTTPTAPALAGTPVRAKREERDERRRHPADRSLLRDRGVDLDHKRFLILPLLRKFWMERAKARVAVAQLTRHLPALPRRVVAKCL